MRADLGAFIHRVLPHHRILPAIISDYPVRLYHSEVDLGRGDSELTLAGVLFPGLDLTCPEHAPSRFRVEQVVCDGIERHVEDHLARAHDEACAVLAFPELTIDPIQRDGIAMALKTRPWAKDEGTEWTLPIVLAGSWHEADGDAWYNLATVFDGYGRSITRHRKLFPYVDRQGRLEDIASGKALTIVVTEDALVAFGVCRDFCERGGTAPNPYSLLDVDLFVIVSYGDDKTMEGHFATANDVRVRYRSEVLVVQQGPHDMNGGLGFVLAPGNGGKVALADVKRTGAWNLAKIPGLPPEKIDSPDDM